MKKLIKTMLVASSFSSISSLAAQYETDEVAEIVYDLPAQEQDQLNHDLDGEPTVHADSVISLKNFRSAYNYLQRMTVVKGPNHRKTINAAKAYEIQKNNNKQLAQQAPILLPWTTEVFETKQSSAVYTNDFLPRLQSWSSGEIAMTEEDQALNFVATKNNKLELYTGFQQYHEKLLSDIAQAKDTIHMQMYGWHADNYGKELAWILAERARSGIKVRVLIDKFGANLANIIFVTGFPMKEVYKTLIDGGVEVVMPSHRGLLRLDHRKQYIIDGKIAWSTGYTISDKMKNEVLDQGTRIQGDLTYQLQATFLTAWLHFGGRIPELDKDKPKAMKKYFAPLDETGRAEVKIVSNISGVKLEVTEDYYEKISNARREVIVINRNFADPRFAKALLKARKNGAEVIVIMEENTKTILGLYKVYTEKYFRKFTDAGIKCYYFRDREGRDMVHSKIVLADDWVSAGSANFDLFSLFHNAEQNIITKDAVYVKAMRDHLLREVADYSNPYVPSKNVFRKIKLSLKALLFKSYEILF
jgi:phosphatidylserine/phosphatidylglycerophosphate/cardiolipin synthase-like enzyme